MSFIRVRSKGGPDAEYDIGVEEATAHPDLYEVIEQPATPQPEAEAPEPSVGDQSEENQS